MKYEISHLIIDVDGTLTDSGVYYDDTGNELKKFSTKDGIGFAIARIAGIKLIILTGRECKATTRRMKELKADLIVQNTENKAKWLKSYMEQNQLVRKDMGYIGDDVNDLGGMQLCEFVGCPSDACKQVRNIASYVSPFEGGKGAVRDCIEYLLDQRGLLQKALETAYFQNNIGI